MALLAFTRDDSVTGDGHIYLQAQADSDFVEKTKPLGVQGARVRPVRLKYKGRVYVFGMFSTPMVITETRRVWSMGIPAPPVAVTMGIGSSSAGSEGLAIGYITFLEKDSGKIIAESNPSLPSVTVTLNGQGRTWTLLPTTCVNPRVTHIRGYVSMDGSVPGLAWERQLGVTTVNENVLTSLLGERLPVSVGLDGAVVTQIYDRGVPPNGRFAEVYHDAMWVSGEYDHPTRIYYGKLFEPEGFNTVDQDRGWFDTLDGEAVTGLQRWGDLLIVGCLRACYAIQGFDSGDYQLIKLSNFYGVISQHSMVRVGPDADLWAAGQEGPWMFNGQFHDLFENDLRDFWRADYQAHPLNYEDSFAGEDRYYRTYQLVVPQDDNTTYKYVCHWTPVVKQGQDPWVVWDIKARKDSSIGTAITADDDHFGSLLTGSCDGYLRKENVRTNADDDNDGYKKALTVVTKHYFMGDQGGDDAHGRNYEDLDVFVQSETTPITVSAYGGDDSANQAATPQWSRIIPAGAVTSPRTKVPRTSFHFSNISECNGKGLTLKFTASAPINVGIRGFAIYHTFGQQERPFSS